MGGQVIAHRGSYIREPFEQALKFEEIFAAISIDRHFPRFPYEATFVPIGREEPGFVPMRMLAWRSAPALMLRSRRRMWC